MRLTLLLLILVTQNLVAADRYILFAKAEDAGKLGLMQSWYFDSAAVKRQGNFAEATYIVDNDKPYPVNDKELSVATVTKFDCVARTNQTLQIRKYAGNMGRGKLINVADIASLNLKSTPVKTGSIWNKVLGMACNQDQLNEARLGSQESKTSSNSGPVSLGSSSSGPSEKAVGQYIDNKVATKAKGLVKFVSFKKTDGLASNIAGISMYEMNWMTTLEVIEDCWLKVETFDAERPNPSSDILFATQRFKPYKKGQRIELTGVTRFQKRESGWRVN